MNQYPQESGHDRPTEDLQLELPLSVRPAANVYWYKMEEVVKRRLFGSRVVHRLMQSERDTAMTTEISVDDISMLSDPDLQYALRFQAAATAAGSEDLGNGMSASHFVQVDATNEGSESRLVSATYSGVDDGKTDTFLENLKRFDPRGKDSTSA